MLSPRTVLSGRYEIIEKVGQGGMATVYKAEDLERNRIVAVKVLKDELAEDEKTVEKFRKEAVSAANLSHPNIVSVYDYAAEGNLHYFVMEYINGYTLKDYIRKKGKLPSEEILRISKCIAAALSEAHEAGIIHRDIKPQNILMTSRGLVKVADFGIARATSSATLTTQHEAVGSVHYMSPEQAKGLTVDAGSDLYSLGISMYEMAVGSVPFDGETPVAIAIQHLNKPLPNPLDENQDLLPGLSDVIRKLTQKNSENRYQAAEEVFEDLDKIEKNENHRIRFVDLDAPEEDTGMTEEEFVRKRGWATFAIMGITVAAILLIALIYNGLRNRVVTMLLPDVVGQTLEEAARIAREEGHSVTADGYTYSTTVPEGCIIMQAPEAGTAVESKTTISVIVSLGIKGVLMAPQVTGMQFGEAVRSLAAAGVPFKLVIASDEEGTAPAGYVHRQSPAPGSPFVNPETGEALSMTLYVSPGQAAETVPVPYLSGLSEENAIMNLTQLGLSVGKISYEYHSITAEGCVIGQSIDSNFTAVKGTPVDLTVSLGMPEERISVKSGGTITISNPASTGLTQTLAVFCTDAEGVQSQLYRADITVDTFSEDNCFLTLAYPDGTAYVRVTLDGVEILSFKINQ